MASKKQSASNKTGKQPIELQDLQRVQGGVTIERAEKVKGGTAKKNLIAKKNL
jgi:hypothetical protein